MMLMVMLFYYSSLCEEHPCLSSWKTALLFEGESGHSMYIVSVLWGECKNIA